MGAIRSGAVTSLAISASISAITSLGTPDMPGILAFLLIRANPGGPGSGSSNCAKVGFIVVVSFLFIFLISRIQLQRGATFSNKVGVASLKNEVAFSPYFIDHSGYKFSTIFSPSLRPNILFDAVFNREKTPIPPIKIKFVVTISDIVAISSG